MQSEWKVVKIEDIAKPEKSALAMGPFGSNIKSDNFVEEGIPVIRGKNISSGRFVEKDFVFLTEEKSDELSNSSVIANDLVFTHRGTLGQVGIIPEDSKYPRYIVSQSQMKLSVDTTKANPLFVFYYFKSPQGYYELLKNTSTTGVPAISRPLTSLRNASITLPPLPTQERIADILGTMDDKIELNRQMNHTLEAMARAIFKSWFVDFDPVYAKIDGSDYPLPAEVMDLFPDELVESELGLIPKGWKVGTLGDLVDLQKESVKANKEKDKERYIALQDMPKKSLATQPFSKGSDVNSSIIRFRRGDILFGSMRPYFHKVSVAWFDGITRTTTFVLRPKLKTMQYFALLHFFSEEVVNFSTVASVGTTIPYIKWDVLMNYQITVPTINILIKFQELITPFFDKIRLNGRQSSSLSQMRDRLLPKLISREIEI